MDQHFLLFLSENIKQLNQHLANLKFSLAISLQKSFSFKNCHSKCGKLTTIYTQHKMNKSSHHKWPLHLQMQDTWILKCITYAEKLFIVYLKFKFNEVKVSQSCLTLCQPLGLYNPWNSPGQNNGVGLIGCPIFYLATFSWVNYILKCHVRVGLKLGVRVRKSSLNIHWKDWCWSWSSNTLSKEPTHWIRPWSWERLKAGAGRYRGRGG